MQAIIRIITENAESRRLSLQDILDLTDVACHPETLRRALNFYGYFRRIALEKPPINEPTRVKRLNFARQAIFWTKE